jgi:uncharacterized membrane protein
MDDQSNAHDLESVLVEGDGYLSDEKERRRSQPLSEKEKQELQARGRKLLFSKPWYTWIIVIFVAAAILWTYLTYLINFVIPWVFTLHRYYGIIFFIIFTILTVLVSYCYYMAVTTHPGLVPDSWVSDQ